MKSLFGTRLFVDSAGVRSGGGRDPFAVLVMEEIGDRHRRPPAQDLRRSRKRLPSTWSSRSRRRPSNRGHRAHPHGPLRGGVSGTHPRSQRRRGQPGGPAVRLPRGARRAHGEGCGSASARPARRWSERACRDAPRAPRARLGIAPPPRAAGADRLCAGCGGAGGAGRGGAPRRAAGGERGPARQGQGGGRRGPLSGGVRPSAPIRWVACGRRILGKAETEGGRAALPLPPLRAAPPGLRRGDGDRPLGPCGEPAGADRGDVQATLGGGGGRLPRLRRVAGGRPAATRSRGRAAA